MKRAIIHRVVWVGLAVWAAGCQTLPEKTAQGQTLQLAAIFGSDMVLQRDVEAPVWGWAEPGRAVRVSVDGAAPLEAVAARDGKWMLRLPAMPAGGPHEIAVASGDEAVVLSNVLMGDVWVCSGQSNMQWPVWADHGDMAFYVTNSTAEVAQATHPDIRLYMVPMTTSRSPVEDVLMPNGPIYPDTRVDILRTWRVCSPETVPPFSAVAYFFGRALQRDEHVPIGLIQTAWGGTVCEAWTSAETLRTLPDFRDRIPQAEVVTEKAATSRRAYRAAVAAWRAEAEARDAGFAGGEPLFAAPSHDDADWPVIEAPNLWETQGYPALDGFAWLRRRIEIPKAWAGAELELHLAGINDANQTWFNGEPISGLDDQAGANTPRTYRLPGHLVKAGENVIALRIYDMGNKGGFMQNVGHMELRNPKAASGPIPLGGPWKMQVGVELAGLPPYPKEPANKQGDANVPTVLYNAMIAPLVPYGIKGAIWYQGESNADRAYQYRSLFPAMITDWRTKWGQGDFPFFFVQLANYTDPQQTPADDAWAELREAQTMTLALPNTGMAVTIDIGEADDIHPRNKQDVGERLALAARHVAYGEALVYSGPLYRAMSVEGGAIRVRFDHAGGGLVSPGGPPIGFTIAGADRKFVWAQARIEGDSVVVSSPEVAVPAAVRYAWAANPLCNLFNAEGLPASPFRTDDWPGLTQPKP